MESQKPKELAYVPVNDLELKLLNQLKSKRLTLEFLQYLKLSYITAIQRARMK